MEWLLTYADDTILLVPPQWRLRVGADSIRNWHLYVFQPIE